MKVLPISVEPSALMAVNVADSPGGAPWSSNWAYVVEQSDAARQEGTAARRRRFERRASMAS